jgi:predicted RNA-binding protein with RPS1 domain
MIHISKLSSEYIGDIRSVIKKDDVVTATVISSAEGRIALSMIGDGVKKKKRTTDYHRENPPMDFESMLSCFKSESEERLSCLPRGSRVCERKRRK